MTNSGTNGLGMPPRRQPAVGEHLGRNCIGLGLWRQAGAWPPQVHVGPVVSEPLMRPDVLGL